MTCVTFLFMIAPRKKPLAYSFLPSFDNTNDRLCRETLGTLRTRQRRRQWKRRWKIDFAPFETFLPLNQVTQLFESREVRSELKRGGCVRVQRERERERVKFIALPFPSSSQIKIWSFHAAVSQGRQRNVQQSVMHV